MEDDQGRFDVKFTGEALEEWRKAFPDMPPGDETVLWMRPEPCSICGTEFGDGELGGMDPEAISADGELIGRKFCQACMSKGH